MNESEKCKQQSKIGGGESKKIIQINFLSLSTLHLLAPFFSDHCQYCGHCHLLICFIVYFNIPLYNSFGNIFFISYFLRNFFLARKTNLYGSSCINRFDKAQLINAIIQQYRAFLAVLNKQSCSSAENKIPVRNRFFKNRASK